LKIYVEENWQKESLSALAFGNANAIFKKEKKNDIWYGINKFS